jgi:hypothetical protein
MSKKRILFVGCSFTANCGFNEFNQKKYHWPRLFSQHYDCFFYNAAVGGMSNDEIFYRTLENCSRQIYDLVVVQWSAIGRHWIYFNQSNIDDFSFINYGQVGGFIPDSSRMQLLEYTRLHYSYFNNDYINLKRWLLLIIALDHILKNQNQSYIFVKGFENHLSDFRNVGVDNGGFQNIEKIRHRLDFDNRPDYYIKEKIQVIKDLINVVDRTHWINFDSTAFNDFSLDLADDQMHPGPLANKKLFLDLIDHCNQRGFLV